MNRTVYTKEHKNDTCSKPAWHKEAGKLILYRSERIRTTDVSKKRSGRIYRMCQK